ncbi:MAG TPA: hypothetical protein DCL15_08045 [Chloroflexi bacterium]|nr:hypothetical protein [Chloroflexota bacterium]
MVQRVGRSAYGKCVCYAWLLACLLWLALPLNVQAQTDEEGCSCHSTERTAWEMSTHGQVKENGAPIAACETCHGVYTRGHPGTDMIPLDADSSVCIECHAAIAHNWGDTVHAQAGVQCIGCHLAHSQDLRLGGAGLCESCHRTALTDTLHTAHWLGDVACTNCHMAEQPLAVNEPLAAAAPALAVTTAPRHDFVAVASNNCLECHAKQVHDAAVVSDPVDLQRRTLIEAVAEAPRLRAQLSRAEQAARATTLLAPMSLGFGISIGGLLGIGFILLAARWGRKGGL